ncbi:MAG: hypothetical protein ACREGI_03925 [Candidatus Levyibacteriota bacterium]
MAQVETATVNIAVVGGAYVAATETRITKLVPFSPWRRHILDIPREERLQPVTLSEVTIDQDGARFDIDSLRNGTAIQGKDPQIAGYNIELFGPDEHSLRYIIHPDGKFSGTVGTIDHAGKTRRSENPLGNIIIPQGGLQFTIGQPFSFQVQLNMPAGMIRHEMPIATIATPSVETIGRVTKAVLHPIFVV